MPGYNEQLAELTDLLRCPITGQQLRIARPEEVRALSNENADGFLVRDDKTVAYPVVNGIPSLLPESGIILQPLT